MPVDEAGRRLLALVARLPGRPVDLVDAAGLVLAGDVVARRSLPGFDNSAMDGFAVIAADTATATVEDPVSLAVTGEVAAGAVFAGEVRPGTAVRIMTGAPVPEGADAIVEVEATRPGPAGAVMVELAVLPGRSVRRAGDDIRPGELALPAGTRLGAGQVGLLAALGEARPVCVPRPRVALAAPSGSAVSLAALVAELGGKPVAPGEEADLVVVAAPAGAQAGAAVAVTLGRQQGRPSVQVAGDRPGVFAAVEAVVGPALRVMAGARAEQTRR